MVKRFIRENNYRDYEKTHNQCIAAGISVNRPALDRFADKLELIDKAERNKLSFAESQQTSETAARVEDMTYEEVKQRETAITFELGALRIKENELLVELTSLSSRLKNKH